jgi:hypothetical protein
MGKTLQSIEANTKTTWSATFWLLGLLAVIIWFGTEKFYRRQLETLLAKAITLIESLTGAKKKPIVNSVNPIQPGSGPTTGGTPITIEGDNFDPKAVVTMRGNHANEVRVESQRRITAVTPAGTIGVADITVENPDGGLAILSRGFTYQLPTASINAIIPNVGPRAGGTGIVLSGANFRQGLRLEMGGLAAANVIVQSENAISAQTPASPNPVGVDISVTNPGEQPVIRATGFTYQ